MDALMLPIPGTWSWKGDECDARTHWWHPSSPWCQFMADRGIGHLCPSEPFLWSTNVNGAAFWRHSHIDWQAGGAALTYYLANPNTFGPHETPEHDRNLVAHSHGALMATHFAASQVPMTLLTVEVVYPVQNQKYSVRLSTLVNPPQ